MENWSSFLLLIFALCIAKAHLASVPLNTNEELYENGNSGGRNIRDFVTMVRTLGTSGLMERYNTFRLYNPEKTFWTSVQPENYNLNRYPFVVMYDYNRVKLEHEDDNMEATTDFVNGNYVDGYKQKREYIAGACPIPTTTGDFFEMVWEQKTVVIVMVTNNEDAGVVKCYQYWPLEAGDSMVYRNLEIKNTNVHVTTDYTVSTFEITNTMESGEVRIVSHWHYTSWPDQKTPPSASSLLEFINGVRAKQTEMAESPAKKHPIVVHCSAGVARTGTFMVLNNAISRLLEHGTVNFSATLQAERDQRPFGIGTPSQWVFAHRALIQFALDRNLLTTDFNLDELHGDDAADQYSTNNLLMNAIYSSYGTAMSHVA